MRRLAGAPAFAGMTSNLLQRESELTLVGMKCCVRCGGAGKAQPKAVTPTAEEASPKAAHSLVYKLVISAPQCALLQRKQQLPEANLRFRRNSAAYRGEPQKRYTTM